ncbi:uncharacterized protein LOC108665565, partial [Hyalella azteca]|uniref:Uncharacterized protein LOC108665565 n=1 Tax=Hyalella azteca TaxID=294128 RepID=A0A8B7N1X0_HYAAZ
MEKVEKKLTRFRANLKTKRKLSLPMFINHFNQQWGDNQSPETAGAGACDDLQEDVENRCVEPPDAQSCSKQNRRYSYSKKKHPNSKGAMLSTNKVNTNSANFGSLASIVFESEREALRRNLSLSTSSGSASFSSRNRTNSTASSTSSDSSSNSLNGAMKRDFSTLPHSISATTGLHLILPKGLRSSSTLPLSCASGVPSRAFNKGLVKSPSVNSYIPYETSGAPLSRYNSAATASSQCKNSVTANGSVRSSYADVNSNSFNNNSNCNGERLSTARNRGRDRHAHHPHLVATISSPGGSTFTSFVLPNDGGDHECSVQNGCSEEAAGDSLPSSPTTLCPPTLLQDDAGQEAGAGRGVRGLRHCDSLEGLCDGPDSR